MQRVAAARAHEVVDIDHQLDARQVHGKRSPDHAALGRSIYPLGRISCISCGLTARRNLLDVLEPEQHLIFGQRLGTPSEAMALQLFDDLEKPLVADALRNQHRFERAGIVGKSIRLNGHGRIRTCVAVRRERFRRADSLCRNHPGCIGAGVSRAA